MLLGSAKILRNKIFQEGKEEGILEGRDEVYRELSEKWEKRKQEAEARGETFDEPQPIPDYKKPLDPNSLNNPMS